MIGEVVATFTFLGDSPDGGDVEVYLAPSGAKNKNVRVRLRTGGLVVALPRRGLTEIIEALQRAKTAADEHYKKLVEKMNQEKSDG
jgi:hypothetical protein